MQISDVMRVAQREGLAISVTASGGTWHVELSDGEVTIEEWSGAELWEPIDACMRFIWREYGP